jgi:serine/threonine-protein kinase
VGAQCHDPSAADEPTVASRAGHPDRIGPYAIERELGRGGMGVVYLARDTRLGRPLAIKLLPAEIAGDADRRARFEREARTAAALNHPNIAIIHELGESGDACFIAMEYVGGCTLGEHLSKSGGVPPAECMRIAEQIAEGLVAAHAGDVVHRDLKPGNVMVTGDGRVKILDFGLAKACDRGPGPGPSDGPTALTEPGQLMGTVDYMSPEQARGQAVDARSDLFSFGAVLYEMATGSPPFRRCTVADTITATLTERPPAVSTLGAGLPSSFARVIHRLLEKNPEDRYQSAAEALEDLRRMRADTEAGTEQTRSIAVLPFADMSPGGDQEYFCDGLAEELINALTQVEGLRVAARTSAFQFKDKVVGVETIGRELRVETVLEGSVRKAGNRLRITAQLVNVADGYHLWSQRYDRDLEDVFAVQDDIASTIVGTLKVKLTRETTAPLVRRYTDNVAAYSLYLKGRHFWNNRHRGLLLKGIDCFEAAIENDPSYALAYAGLADSYSVQGFYSFIPPQEACEKALEAAQQAVRLDESLAEGRLALGTVRFWYEWDLRAAEQEIDRAIDLNPKFALACAWKAQILGSSLRPDEAARYARRALELDPLSPAVTTIAGFVLVWSGLYEEACQVACKGLEIAPNHMSCTWLLSSTYSLRSMHDEGIAAAERVVELTDRAPFMLGVLGEVYAMAGRRDDALRIIDEIKARAEKTSAGSVAIVYGVLGEVDEAVAWLERAVEQRSAFLPYAALMREFESLRGDARFDELLRRAGIPTRSRP